MASWSFASKNRSNFTKHGLDFADAQLVFAGPCVTFVDDRFDYGEERFVTLGLLAGRLVAIAHAPRSEATRISMRKANRLDWLKANGRGYQTRINRILRAAMESRPPRRTPSTTPVPKKNARTRRASRPA